MTKSGSGSDVSQVIRDLALDVALRTARAHGERDTAVIAAGLAAALWQLLSIHHGPSAAQSAAIAIIQSAAGGSRP